MSEDRARIARAVMVTSENLKAHPMVNANRRSRNRSVALCRNSRPPLSFTVAR